MASVFNHKSPAKREDESFAEATIRRTEAMNCTVHAAHTLPGGEGRVLMLTERERSENVTVFTVRVAEHDGPRWTGPSFYADDTPANPDPHVFETRRMALMRATEAFADELADREGPR